MIKFKFLTPKLVNNDYLSAEFSAELVDTHSCHGRDGKDIVQSVSIHNGAGGVRLARVEIAWTIDEAEAFLCEKAPVPPPKPGQVLLKSEIRNLGQEYWKGTRTKQVRTCLPPCASSIDYNVTCVIEAYAISREGSTTLETKERLEAIMHVEIVERTLE